MRLKSNGLGLRPLPASGLTAALFVLVVATTFSSTADARKKRPKGKEVCALFSAAPAKQLLGPSAVVEPSRFASMCTFKTKAIGAAAAEKAYSEAMRKSMVARMSGKKVEKIPRPHVANTISVVFQGDRDSAESAAAKMEGVRRMLREGFTVSTRGSRAGGFKSKVKVGNAAAKSTAEVDKVTDDVADDVVGRLKKVEKNAGRQLPGADKEVSAKVTAQSDIEMQEVTGIDEAHYATKYHNVTARKGKRIVTVEVRMGKRKEDEKALALALAIEWLNQK